MTKQHNIAERSPWRWPAAAVALTVAAAHIPITAEHLSEAPYIGWSFVALEIAAVALAITLVLYDAGMVWRVAASLCAAALAAYMLTRTVALPQIGDDLGNWGEPLGVVALTAESMLVVLSLVRNWPMIRESRLGRHPAVVAAALLATGLTAIGCVSGRGEAMAGMESAGDGGSNSMSVSLPLQWASFAHWLRAALMRSPVEDWSWRSSRCRAPVRVGGARPRFGAADVVCDHGCARRTAEAVPRRPYRVIRAPAIW